MNLSGVFWAPEIHIRSSCLIVVDLVAIADMWLNREYWGEAFKSHVK